MNLPRRSRRRSGAVSSKPVPLGGRQQSPHRESLIESVLAKPFLIYGAKVCQSCGRVMPFRGWAAAMASHRHRHFECSECRRQLSSEGFRRSAGSDTRFCEICTSRGPWEVTAGGAILCPSRRKALVRRHPGESLEKVLSSLSRRRNLEQRTTASLEDLDLNSEVARLEDEVNRVRRSRENDRLARKARRRLRRRHGLPKSPAGGIAKAIALRGPSQRP